MRILAILFIFLQISFYSEGQVAVNTMNIVYRGIPNSMSFGFFGYDCKNVQMQVDTGSVTFFEEPDQCGSFLYSAPDSGNIANFTFFAKTKKGARQIYKAKFRIKDLPAPTAYIGGINVGEINISNLRVQQGMISRIEGMDICADFRIDSFSYVIMRNEKAIIVGKNIGAYFDNNFKSYVSALEHKDKILFYNIFCQGPDRKIRKPETFELTAVK